MYKNSDNDNKKTNGCATPLVKNLIIIAWIFIFIVIVAPMFIKSEPEQPALKPVNLNQISKSTFKGDWALTVDSAQIYCVDLGSTSGAKVIINGKPYAITRNITNLEFLPGNLWADETRPEKQFLSIDGKYKVPLTDFVNYADFLYK